MLRILKVATISALTFTAHPSEVLAHSGGLNSEGCHNDRKRGGYHCHRNTTRKTAPRYTAPQGFISSGVGSYRNCAAARAAGAAPVYRGDPGYGAHLDRDNDGVGCE
ncbi:excalibur calcium-binding domain-containing protein [Fuscibacter oryzae]|uniref:Excalibur calcium-binding domain-containing protein n=1 Tax=Fuscibacter oryzae TaxID=2803939 RepID=A0A8J7SVN5_9RHOB|nr:excalibur calcium-binding domain-containing protein [Fuscibacter oryzae]MBL4928014.1 excalibur calcium-binding domain-containing protein [Fuscibacter oryzae]